MRGLRVKTFLHIFPLKYGVVTAALIALLTSILECLLGVAVLKNPESAGLENQSRVIGVLFLLLSCWNLVLCIFLIRAMISGEPNYMRPWLIYMLLNVVLAYTDIMVSIWTGQFRIFFRLLEATFFTYLWIVVYSYSILLYDAKQKKLLEQQRRLRGEQQRQEGLQQQQQQQQQQGEPRSLPTFNPSHEDSMLEEIS